MGRCASGGSGGAGQPTHAEACQTCARPPNLGLARLPSAQRSACLTWRWTRIPSHGNQLRRPRHNAARFECCHAKLRRSLPYGDGRPSRAAAMRACVRQHTARRTPSPPQPLHPPTAALPCTMLHTAVSQCTRDTQSAACLIAPATLQERSCEVRRRCAQRGNLAHPVSATNGDNIDMRTWPCHSCVLDSC